MDQPNQRDGTATASSSRDGKGKHCGAVLARPAPSAPPRPKGRFSRIARSLLTGPAGARLLPLAAVAGVLLSVCIGFAMRDSELWVSLHGDVQWHREWQDSHAEEDPARVAALYARLARKAPGDPGRAYLAARVLPRGKEKTEALEAASVKYPYSPWILWGRAALAEEAGRNELALELRLEALSRFKEEPPTPLLATAIMALAVAADWETLSKLYQQHSQRIDADGTTAWAMAFAEFCRGDHRAASAWARKAERLTGGRYGPARSASLAASAVRRVGEPRARPAQRRRLSVGARLATRAARPSPRPAPGRTSTPARPLDLFPSRRSGSRAPSPLAEERDTS